METLYEMVASRLEHLTGRASGPLNFRLVVMPIVVTIMAIRAHVRDVREGRPTILWVFFKDADKRRRLLRSGLKDFGKVFIVACVLDTVYQIWVLRSYYFGEMLVCLTRWRWPWFARWRSSSSGSSDWRSSPISCLVP